MKTPSLYFVSGTGLLAVLLPLLSAQVDTNGNEIPASPAPGYAVQTELAPEPSPKSSAAEVRSYEELLSDRGKEYQEFLGKETERHQEFLRDIFTVVTWVFGILASIFTGALIIFSYKSRKDIREEIDIQLKARAKAIIDAEVIEFQTYVTDNKNAITELRKGVEKLKVDTSEEALEMVDYASVIAHAAVVIGLDEDNDPGELRIKTREHVKERLLLIQNKIPTHRTLAIFIARLCRQLKQWDQAIQALDRTIVAREKRKLDSQRDHAALLYNKACYQNLGAGQQSGVEQERWRMEAWKTIRKSVQIHPENLAEAKLDPDLAGLAQPPERDWDTLLLVTR